MTKAKLNTQKILQYTLTAIIPILILLLSLHVVVFNRSLHNTVIEFSNTPFVDEIHLSNQVYDYLEYKTDKLDMDFFTLEEKDHLKDVRSLVSFSRTLLIALIIVTIILGSILYTQNRNLILTVLYSSGLATIALIIIVGILSFISFNLTFDLFHKIFFPQGNYLFKTNLPKLFNQTFFFIEAATIGVIALIESVIIILPKMLKE